MSFAKIWKNVKPILRNLVKNRANDPQMKSTNQKNAFEKENFY